VTKESYDLKVTQMRGVYMPKNTFLNLEEEKRNKILKSAISEFSANGFEKGNVAAIAKNAGVSKGSMYQYFNDKKDIYLYCIEKAYEISLKYVENRTKEYYKMSVFDYTYLGFKNAWSFLVDEREVYILLENAAFDMNSDIGSEVLKIIYRDSVSVFNSITEMIDMNKEKGLIKTQVSTDLILIYITAISAKFKEKMLFIAKEKGKKVCDMSFEDFEPLIKDMISLIKNGIG